MSKSRHSCLLVLIVVLAIVLVAILIMVSPLFPFVGRSTTVENYARDLKVAQARYRLVTTMARVLPEGFQQAVRFVAVGATPIALRGQALDQYDQPVPYAEIGVYAERGSFVPSFPFGSRNTVTDEKGVFDIARVKGVMLSIYVNKDGYLPSSDARHFDFSPVPTPGRFVPDPKKPEMFRMWKCQGYEPLVRFGFQFGRQQKDSEVRLDFLAAKQVSEGGDLSLTIQPVSALAVDQGETEWEVKLVAVDGSIQEASDESERFVHQAPDHGYQTEIAYRVRTKSGLEGGLCGKHSFVQSRKSKVISKVCLDLDTEPPPNELCLVRVRGIANPNGSRNWEVGSTNVTQMPTPK